MLQELAHETREINTANGWNVTVESDWVTNPYKIPAITALIHSEVTEALEAYRENNRENFCEEMADIVIRVLDCVVAFDDDFDATLRTKLEFNKARGYRHGGKAV